MKKLFFALTAGVLMAASACTTDPCKDVTCSNGGTCADGTCICAAGYEGTDCSTEWSTKFTGTWNASEVVTGANPGTYTYTATVTAGSPTTIAIGNIGGFLSSVAGTITSSTTGSISTTDASGRAFSGQITSASATAVNVTYSVTYSDGTVDNCNASFTK